MEQSFSSSSDEVCIIPNTKKKCSEVGESSKVNSKKTKDEYICNYVDALSIRCGRVFRGKWELRRHWRSEKYLHFYQCNCQEKKCMKKEG